MSFSRLLLAAGIALAIVFATPRSLSSPEAAQPQPQSPSATGWPVSNRSWRSDEIWFDGEAECCVYAATQVIYGEARAYEARAYTNKQHMDPRTTTKSAAGAPGVSMFKHHWSERIPTENYDYDYSTAVFLATDNLAAAKLTAATQEDCGASFKQAWREGTQLRWLESIYLPEGGVREDTLRKADGLVFEDDFTLRLRDYPFGAPRDITLRVLPTQRSPRSVNFVPETRTVRHLGRESLTLPIGTVDAHHLVVEDRAGTALAHYWFDADGSAPRLHTLVRFESPDRTLSLTAHERRAYWKR